MVDYQGRKIVIIGLGETGLSCIDFFLKQDVIPRVMDTRILPPGLLKLPKQVKCYLGGINGSWLWESDLIVISPGVEPWHPTINKAAELGIEVIGDIELFCREAKAPIIAITGSNGKSTVTMLFSEMIREAGWRVSVGGNIGLPALKILKPSTQIYVLELSSFQLETTYSLQAAVAAVLNITEDHMDRYPLGMFQYSAAKLRIYNNASICIFNAENYMTTPVHNSTLNSVSFGINSGDYRLYESYGNTWLKVKGKKVLNTNKMKLLGQYNYLNALAALALADSIKIPRSYSLKALTNFPGLPHRFQVIHEANGVLWINNSKATNVSSTEVALNSLRVNGKLWLLLGGDSKMADFSPLIKYLQNNDYVRLFCFGQDGDLLASLCPSIATRTETLQQAMQQIALQVKTGDIVLLSPACASFDQFRNFEHRGEVFTELAKELG